MLEPVIGLEIHVQLKTKSKMFCGCSVHETNVAPNTNICPICTGHPGTLPVPNAQAIRFSIRMGLALNCSVTEHSKFDRKNYFYPDLPKAYQISQYDLPIVKEGHVDIEIPGGEIRTKARIGITRAHLEEDAAKSFHDDSGKTFVDYNRGGTPLLEIVTEPDFRSPQEAKIFLQELRLIARYLGVSDADMEKGHLRCDANISLRETDKEGNIVGPKFHPKTEIKNINSFRHVERALEYEIRRQTKLWEAGSPPAQSTTRGWNDAKQVTEDQRTKEEAADYRYFPEPDIPTLELKELADELRGTLPELPTARRERFVSEYTLKPEDAKQLCEDVSLANFTEQVFSELFAWLDSLPDLDDSQAEEWAKEKKKLGKLVAGWLLSKLGGLLAERHLDWEALTGTQKKITAENFAEFITLLTTNKLSTNNGLLVLKEMLDTGGDPSQIIEEKQLERVEDAGALVTMVDQVIAKHPEEVTRFKAGKQELLQFFVGQIMKASNGSADAAATRDLLLKKLK